MKKEIYLVIILFWLFQTPVNAQRLNQKGIEKFDGLNQNIVVDASSGFILTDSFLGSKSKRQATALNTIQVEEKLVYIHGTTVFSQRNEADINSTLKKYILINNTPIEEKSLEFGALMITAFFESGSFVTMNDREEGGLSVKIYNNDQQLLREYTPFKSGFQPATYHINKNHFVMVAAPAFEKASSQLIAFNSHGELLFNKALDAADANVQNVIAGDNYFAVYSFNGSTRMHVIMVYNTKGSLLWRTNIDSMVQKWAFYEASFPLLVIGTTDEILLFDVSKEMLIDRKKLAEFYLESSGKLIAAKYIEIVAIKPLFDNKLLGVLISEPTSLRNFTNNLLYSFDGKLNDHKQLIKIGNSKNLPTLLNSTNEVLIVKDNEILKYSYEK